MTPWTETSDGVLLTVRAQPRSSRSEIDGLLGDALKVRLKGAPVDGQANEELVRLFAKAFRLPKSSIVIKSGATAKTKTILLRTLTLDAFLAQLPKPTT